MRTLASPRLRVASRSPSNAARSPWFLLPSRQPARHIVRSRYWVMSMADPPRRQFGFPPASRAQSSVSTDAARADTVAAGGVYFAGEIAQPKVTQASPLLVEDWIPSLAPREQGLLRFLLTEEPLRQALCEGPVIELRASGDETQSSLLPASAVVEINSGDAVQANGAVRQLKGELGVLLI